MSYLYMKSGSATWPLCKTHMTQQCITDLGPISPIGFHSPLCYTGFSFLMKYFRNDLKRYNDVSMQTFLVKYSCSFLYYVYHVCLDICKSCCNLQLIVQQKNLIWTCNWTWTWNLNRHIFIQKIHLKMPSGKYRSFCLGVNVLNYLLHPRYCCSACRPVFTTKDLLV